jgi:lipopolysaccharide/colanic/teichoic acid biosynthesis glycosyltransferase
METNATLTINELKTSTAIQPKKILYVGTNCKLFCQQMVELNYIGLSLNNSFKAYCWLKKMAECNNLPDAIICDLKLEGGDAYNLFDSLKEDEQLRNIPFIVISKSFSREEKLEALKHGFDDFYPYPPNAYKIHKRLSFLMENPKSLKRGDSTSNSLTNRDIPLVKRVFDIVVASTLLLLLSPLMLLVMLLIKLESRGPVFYISKRAGRGYKVFDFYKFRSMRVGADKELAQLADKNIYSAQNLKNNAFEQTAVEGECIDCLIAGKPCSNTVEHFGRMICEKQLARVKHNKPSFIKLENDPRVTKIGKFIRKTSIDELPQLINVLKGDMSIVGNRPLPLYEAEQLTTDLWAKRFMAPAGITGLWQVAKGGKASISDTQRKMLDVVYATKFNIWLDIKIMMRTLPAMIQKG